MAFFDLLYTGPAGVAALASFIWFWFCVWRLNYDQMWKVAGYIFGAGFYITFGLSLGFDAVIGKPVHFLTGLQIVVGAYVALLTSLMIVGIWTIGTRPVPSGVIERRRPHAEALIRR